jgi:hypothetical protein
VSDTWNLAITVRKVEFRQPHLIADLSDRNTPVGGEYSFPHKSLNRLRTVEEIIFILLIFLLQVCGLWNFI